MSNLIIASLVAFSGKTALSLGLGLHLKRLGKQVGYFKPLSMRGYVFGRVKPSVDQDADFVRRVFGLTVPAQDLAPLMVDDEILIAVTDGQLAVSQLWKQVEKFYDDVKLDKEIMLIEGGATISDGVCLELDLLNIAERLDAQVLIITNWHDTVLMIDDVIAAKRLLGKRMVGVVLNNVPSDTSIWNTVQQYAVSFLEKHGISVYGVLPRQDALRAITIGELSDLLEAQVLVGANRRDRLVESIAVGAMLVESALPTLQDHANKVVITGGDRTDLLAAALESQTVVCLILTGNIVPTTNVLKRAEEIGTAVLLTKESTFDVLDIVELAFGKTPLVQAEKLNRFQALLAQYLNYERLLADILVN